MGHLYNLHHLAEQELVDFPFHVQFVLGVLGANAATIEQLVHMRRTARSSSSAPTASPGRRPVWATRASSTSPPRR